MAQSQFMQASFTILALCAASDIAALWQGPAVGTLSQIWRAGGMLLQSWPAFMHVFPAAVGCGTAQCIISFE